MDILKMICRAVLSTLITALSGIAVIIVVVNLGVVTMLMVPVTYLEDLHKMCTKKTVGDKGGV